nr:FAD:protein FMN transferase [Oscillibacter sp.]
MVKLWDFLSQTPQIPSAERIRAVLDRVGYQHVRLDRNTRTVTFDLLESVWIRAQLEGLRPGLTVDRLRQGGVRQAVLDYGGNLFVIGAHQDAQGGTRPWKVAIRDPDNTGSVFGTVQLQDAGIATSSWYEHSFQKNGTVYHHLLDPRTGYPMPLTLKSVSILSSRPVYTDLLSTAFFILGEEEGGVLVDRLRRDSGEMIEYVAVREDGTVAASPGAAFAPA